MSEHLKNPRGKNLEPKLIFEIKRFAEENPTASLSQIATRFNITIRTARHHLPDKETKGGNHKVTRLFHDEDYEP